MLYLLLTLQLSFFSYPGLFFCPDTLCESLSRLQIPPIFHVGFYQLPMPGSLSAAHRQLKMEYRRQFVQSPYTSDEKTEASIIKLINISEVQQKCSYSISQYREQSFYLSTRILYGPDIFYSPILQTWVNLSLFSPLIFFLALTSSSHLALSHFLISAFFH